MLSTFSDVADVELSSDSFNESWFGVTVPRSVQPAGDLGVRLFHALAAAFESHWRASRIRCGCNPWPNTRWRMFLQLRAAGCTPACSKEFAGPLRLRSTMRFEALLSAV